MCVLYVQLFIRLQCPYLTIRLCTSIVTIWYLHYCLVLIISMCYNTPHPGIKLFIISCPFCQTINNILLKLRIGSIKVMRQLPISVPDTKGELHIFCLTSLLCRHFEYWVVLEVPCIGTNPSSACSICYGMEHKPTNYELAIGWNSNHQSMSTLWCHGDPSKRDIYIERE